MRDSKRPDPAKKRPDSAGLELMLVGLNQNIAIATARDLADRHNVNHLYGYLPIWLLTVYIIYLV